MRITIGGESLPIAFTMGAWRMLEEEGGFRLSSLSAAIRGEDESAKADALVKLLSAVLRAASPGMSRRAAAELIGVMTDGELTMAMADVAACVREAMALQLTDTRAQDDYDPVLARLDEQAGDGRTLSWRKAAAWGLVAGIPLAEQEHLAPGLVLDCFWARQQYDDQEHGIKRKKPDSALDDVPGLDGDSR